MTSATDHGTHPGRLDSPDVRPLAVFAAVAVPIGWVFPSGCQVLDLPPEPFVLLTLLIGLVLPAAVLVRRDPGASDRDLLRDCLRPFRPALLLVPALVAIPATTAAVAALAGVSVDLDADLAIGLAVNVVSSVLIVNLWEELARTGFLQRRATSRWGLAGGSLVAEALFAAIHLPLAFDGADGAGVGLRLLVAGFDVWSGRSLLTVAVLQRLLQRGRRGGPE